MRTWLTLAIEGGSPGDALAAQNNLADLALACGNATEAVQLNRELAMRLSGTRYVWSLASVRHNLTSALLSTGDVQAAREAARAGWPLAGASAFEPYWAGTLARMAALEGRPRAAAMLVGCCEARVAALGEVLEHNERANVQRARDAAEAALAPETLADLIRAGADLGGSRIGEIGLATDDIR